MVLTYEMRPPCWCTEQWQNVAQVLRNNRIKVPRDFFHYCSVHQHGRRDVTWKTGIIRAFDLFFHQWNEFAKILILSFTKNKTRAVVTNTRNAISYYIFYNYSSFVITDLLGWCTLKHTKRQVNNFKLGVVSNVCYWSVSVIPYNMNLSGRGVLEDERSSSLWRGA